MVPAPLPNGRLTELLDQIRAEFEGQQNKSEDYERNSKFASTPSLFAQRFCSMHPSVSLLLLCILEQQIRFPLYHIECPRCAAVNRVDRMNFEDIRNTLTGHFESIVAQQMQEMEMVRQKVFNLEQAQLNMKQR